MEKVAMDQGEMVEQCKPFAIKLRMDQANSEHIRASVFMGRDMDHLAHAGQIVVYPHEWGLLQEVLNIGCRVKRVKFKVQPLEDQ